MGSSGEHVAQCLRHWESGSTFTDRQGDPIGLPALSVSETPTYMWESGSTFAGLLSSEI